MLDRWRKVDFKDFRKIYVAPQDREKGFFIIVPSHQQSRKRLFFYAAVFNVTCMPDHAAKGSEEDESLLFSTYQIEDCGMTATFSISNVT